MTLNGATTTYSTAREHLNRILREVGLEWRGGEIVTSADDGKPGERHQLDAGARFPQWTIEWDGDDLGTLRWRLR